jgi:hypothetical protein
MRDDFFWYGRRALNDLESGYFTPYSYTAKLKYNIGNYSKDTLYTYQNYTNCHNTETFIDPRKCDINVFTDPAMCCTPCSDPQCEVCVWDYQSSTQQCILCKNGNTMDELANVQS